MQLRETFQRGEIEWFDEYARSRLDLDYQPKEPEDWEFGGYWWPKAEVRRLWRKWNEHGIMPFAGGYYDQPLEWRTDMEMCDAIYGTRAWLIENDLRRKRQAQGK